MPDQPVQRGIVLLPFDPTSWVASWFDFTGSVSVETIEVGPPVFGVPGQRMQQYRQAVVFEARDVRGREYMADGVTVELSTVLEPSIDQDPGFCTAATPDVALAVLQRRTAASTDLRLATALGRIQRLETALDELHVARLEIETDVEDPTTRADRLNTAVRAAERIRRES